jgi:signal transduction histidine kinase
MRRVLFASLRTRLFLLVALAVLPALGLIFYNDLEQRRLTTAQAQEDALRFAQLAAAEQAQLIQSAHQLLVALAELPAVRDGDAKACSELFSKLLKRYPTYVNLGASYVNGEVFCSASPLLYPVNVSSFAWFQRVVQSQEFSIGDYQKSAISGDFVLIVGSPIFNMANQLHGVVAASLDLSRLSQLATRARLPEGATLTAIDRNGTIVAYYPDPHRWIGRILKEEPLAQAMLTQGEGIMEAQGIDGQKRLHAFTYMHEAGDVGLYVSIGIPVQVAFAPAHRRLVRNLTALGVITLLMFVATWGGSNFLILRPVHALLRATRQLREGNLHARTGLPQGLGELEQLVVAFDDMAEALENREVERQHTEQTLQHLSRRILEAQEGERRAIARELHDELGQALQALKINLQTAQRAPQIISQRLEESIGIVDRTLQQVRNLSLDLRPSLLDDLGLIAALEWYIERHTQRTGILGHFAANPPDLRLPSTLETACFRVTQEALTNVARYAQARNVWIELSQQGARLQLRIRDDGVGFDSQTAQARAAQGTSFGLLGMRERVELVGGHFEVMSAPGRGAEIRANFPLGSAFSNAEPGSARFSLDAGLDFKGKFQA